jgi:tetratricopeptide (TPR) repeat protein
MSSNSPQHALSTGLIAFLFACAALTSACSSTSSDDRDAHSAIRHAVRHGSFEKGVRLADDLVRSRPHDPQAAEIHRLASVAFFLDQGRQASFHSEDEVALEWFLKAQSIAPAKPLVQTWLAKTRQKLETLWLAKGHESFANDDLESALLAYREARRHDPASEQAQQGVEHVTMLIEYRQELGNEYYSDGVRSLAEYWLERARRSFAVTSKYQPNNIRALKRTGEVDVQLADQRIAVATNLEAEGFFHGAHNEFRLAGLLDPSNPMAAAGGERVAQEARASEFLYEATMQTYRKKYAEATRLLDEGESMTSVQHEAFSTAREAVLQARMQGVYDRALVLEHDQLYAEAAAVYGEILEQVEYFLDVRARQATLDGYVQMAAGYYAKAKAESDSAQQLEHLRAISGFWPDYLDIKARIATLEGSD